MTSKSKQGKRAAPKPTIKPWILAYEDKKAGMTHAQIADKYGVSPLAVKSWAARHWKAMQEQDAAMDANMTDGRNQDADADANRMQAGLVTIVPSRCNSDKGCFAGLVQKQISDTLPDKIYAEYSRDNLPAITDREARFVEEYLIDLSKQDAAIRAGYSISNAAALGCKVYNKPDVNAHIQAALAERRKRTGCNADTALQELARIALVNPAKVVSGDGELLESASNDDLAAISSIKVKSTPTKDGGTIVEREVRFHDKIKALELYMRQAGMLIERKQIDQVVTYESAEDRQRRINELLRASQADTFDTTATVIRDEGDDDQG